MRWTEKRLLSNFFSCVLFAILTFHIGVYVCACIYICVCLRQTVCRRESPLPDAWKVAKFTLPTVPVEMDFTQKSDRRHGEKMMRNDENVNRKLSDAAKRAAQVWIYVYVYIYIYIRLLSCCICHHFILFSIALLCILFCGFIK